MKEQSFILWIIQACMCIILQGLGNTNFPDIKNFGVVVALLFVSSYLGDLYNLIVNIENDKHI